MVGGSANTPGGGAEDDLDSPSDEELSRRLRGGDRGALEMLVRRYIRAVHAVAASFLDDPSEVEDAAQESFLRALEAIDRYDPGRPFAPWLYQIARNVARNRLSARRRWQLEPLPARGEMESGNPDPERTMELTEIRDRVEKEMARLPEQRRTAFRLVDVEGMTAEEAGGIMGLTPGTVRSHVHHARRTLRAALTEHVDVSPGKEG